MFNQQYKPKEFQRVLRNNGWAFVRQRGSHQIWKRDGETLSLPVVTLKPCISGKLIKEYQLAV